MIMRLRIHKLLNQEYWPFWFFYLPVFVSWPLLAIRGKSLLFFTKINPFIPYGGCFGESKSDILQFIPKNFLPVTILVNDETSWKHKSFSYPVILKPDVGERGDNILIVHSENEISAYQAALGRPFLIQEFLTEKFEAGVMVARTPGTRNFEITSIVMKEFLSVTGDGKKVLRDLVEQDPRALMQWPRLQKNFDGERILKNGETLLLEPVGNHKRGTKFLDGNHLLTPALQAAMNEISQSIPDFDFGRFDIKAPSAESLAKGLGIKIMELNGAFSEPGHIYDPSATLLVSWRDLLKHWWTLATLAGSRTQETMTIPEFLNSYHQHRKLTQWND